MLLDKNKTQSETISRLEKELEKTKTALGSIQTTVVSSSDRFQPAFDESIVSHFNSLDSSATTLIMFLGGLPAPKSQLDEWPKGTLWDDCVNYDIGPMPFDNKRSRRKVMTVVIWKFLDDFLFKRGFKCFEGALPQEVEKMYMRLFKEGRYCNLS